jgi:tRNA(fMet)-specific endonuclease VapC
VPVLDTDILTLIQRQTEPFYSRLVRRLHDREAGSPVRVTIISFEEQMRGWLKYIKTAKPAALPGVYSRLWRLHQDFNSRPVLPFDNGAAGIYDSLLQARTGVGSMDLRIAAICLSQNELLITANLRDFRKVPGLRAEDWSQ